MNKRVVNRIIELRREVEQLPAILLSENNFDTYCSAINDEERHKVEAEIGKIKDNKDKVLRKIIGFLTAKLEDNNIYYTQLVDIKFTPKEGLYNITHYRNNEAWESGRAKLLNLLEILENEMIERKNKPQVDREPNVFSSGLFWTVVSLIAGLSYFLGTYKAEFDKSKIEKELSILIKENDDLKKDNTKLRQDTESLINQRTSTE